MHVPTEILMSIASNLSAADLSAFRQVNSVCARAGAAFVPLGGLSVLNTTRDIQDLQRVTSCPDIALNVRTLRLFHAEWPVCTRQEWETHCLLFGGNTRYESSICSISDASKRNKAFAAYKKFIQEEQQRRYADEIESLAVVLKTLPNVERLTVSSMHDYFWNPSANNRYRRFQNSIWISPYHSTEVSPSIEAIFLASHGQISKLRHLHIHGYLDPQRLQLDSAAVQLSGITNLDIQSFRVCENERSITGFLEMFPNLRNLSAVFHGWGPAVTILESLWWHQLEHVRLQGLWTSENEFFTLVFRHQATLRSFDLVSSALTQGSWKSLFTRIKDLRSQVTVNAAGELYGRTSKETLNMTSPENLAEFHSFMMNDDRTWPFASHVSAEE